MLMIERWSVSETLGQKNWQGTWTYHVSIRLIIFVSFTLITRHYRCKMRSFVILNTFYSIYEFGFAKEDGRYEISEYSPDYQLCNAAYF